MKHKIVWFEKKFGYSEIIALVAIGFSLIAIWQAHLSRKDARLISRLDLRPNIRLSSDFKRIKIAKKINQKEIKEKGPYFLIENNGSLDAIQLEVQIFMYNYSPEKGGLKGGVTASMYHWVIEKLPPLKSKVFPINEWIYTQPTAHPPLWTCVLEIRITYRRNPDLHKFLKRAFYFVGPQDFWVSESDRSTLNTERYKPIVRAVIGKKAWEFRLRYHDILHDNETE